MRAGSLLKIFFRVLKNIGFPLVAEKEILIGNMMTL